MLASVQLPEYALQALLTGLLLLGGKWFALSLHAVMLAYNVRIYMRGDHSIDATDIFHKVGRQKNIRIGKLIFYLASLILLIYRYTLTVQGIGMTA